MDTEKNAEDVKPKKESRQGRRPVGNEISQQPRDTMPPGAAPTNPDPDLQTVSQAAKATGYSIPGLYRWQKMGLITTYFLGSNRIKAVDVKEIRYLERQAEELRKSPIIIDD